MTNAEQYLQYTIRDLFPKMVTSLPVAKIWVDKYKLHRGEEGIIDMAGFAQYMEGNVEDLKQTLLHDLTGASDRYLVPKTKGYGKEFKEHILY